ncbi:MAG: hypothetical protein ACE5O2_12105, partial [Armatimonadota bacterium]
MRSPDSRGVFVGIMALILSATAGQATNKSSSSLGELKARLKQRIHATSGPAAGQTSGQWGTRQTGSEVNHHGARLHCSDCHVMHASKDGQTFGGGGANPSGYAKLLRGATSLEVCLTCHDGVAGIPDVVGADELADKISKGFMDFDVLIATPDAMRSIARLGKLLGPRGLMPNPKSGTVSFEVRRTVQEFKAGRVEFKVDSTA